MMDMRGTAPLKNAPVPSFFSVKLPPSERARTVNASARWVAFSGGVQYVQYVQAGCTHLTQSPMPLYGESLTWIRVWGRQTAGGPLTVRYVIPAEWWVLPGGVVGVP
jgi:hypothetical protein